MEKVDFVFLLLFLQYAICSEIDLETNLISDLINSLKTPSSVTFITCWSLFKKVQVYSGLIEKNLYYQNLVEFVSSGGTPINFEQRQHVVFLADLRCNDVLKSLKMYNEEKMFAAPFRWILIDLNVTDLENNENLENINLHVDSKVLVIHQLNKFTYTLNYIYKIRPDGSWKTELYGTWNASHGLQKTTNFIEVTALRRLDLENYEIKICYVLTDYDSINHLTDEVNDHIDTITKVNFPTTNQLLDFLNAGRKYLYTDTWGYRRNNSWSGMTGYLVREEVDIGGSPMFLTSERLSVIEYISSPTPTRSKFVFQQPKLSYENNLFLLSFKYSLWVGSSVLILLIYLMLSIVTFWEWRKGTGAESHVEDAGVLRPNLIDVALFIFGTTCQQGSTVDLKGSLGRMVLLFLFVTVTFLYTSYSANIVALLQSSSSQIHTLEDLLHSRIKFGVHDNVFNRYYFSTETEPVRKAIYETKVAPPGNTPRFMSMEKGVKEIRKGLFAFHMETGVGYKFVGKYFEEGEKCGLKEIQYLRVIDPWLAVRKNTPFMEMFKIGTKRLQEHGLQQRENRLLYEKRPKCSGREANFVSVSMVDCYPALLVLSYGALIALTIAIAEIVHHRRHQIVKKIEKGFVCLINFVNGRDFDNEVEMMADVISSYNKPSNILVYDCWTATNKLKFVSKLADMRPPKNVQFIQNADILEKSRVINNLIIVADLICPNVKHFLNQANATNKLRHPYRWLIVDRSTDSNRKIPSDLNDLNILCDSEVILSQKDGNQVSLNLIYKLNTSSNVWKLENFGAWTLRGLNKSKDMEISIPMRRKNLEGTPIGISVVVSENETKLDLLTFNLNLNHINVDYLSKACTRQVDPLFYFINATRFLVYTDNWGYLVNGTYNGMIGDIVSGAAELTGTVIFISKSRLTLLEYLGYPTQLKYIALKFVFRQPSLSYQNNLFVLPFKANVWLSIAGVVILMMFITYINAHWERVKLKNSDNLDRTFLDPKKGEVAMMIIGAVTQQGSYTELKGTLGRAVMFLVLLLFLFLYTSYSANIVALLQSSSNDIKTLADLLNSKMELGSDDTPYNRHHFSVAKEPIRKAIYEKKIAPRGSKPNFFSLEEGVKRMQKKPFAFHMLVGGGYRLVDRYFLEHEKCGLKEIQFLQEIAPWQTCRKSSPFKEIYKIGLSRNKEHGLNDRVNRLIYRKKPECIVHGGIFDSVNMTDFYPAILMLVYGMILAVVLLIIELLHYQRLQRNQKHYFFA